MTDQRPVITPRVPRLNPDPLLFPDGCTCDPEAYELGPEGQRRYFEDRYCPIHGEEAQEAPDADR